MRLAKRLVWFIEHGREKEKNGRSEAIWTPDIQFPKLALYQAELRSDQAPKGKAN